MSDDTDKMMHAEIIVDCWRHGGFAQSTAVAKLREVLAEPASPAPARDEPEPPKGYGIFGAASNPKHVLADGTETCPDECECRFWYAYLSWHGDNEATYAEAVADAHAHARKQHAPPDEAAIRRQVEGEIAELIGHDVDVNYDEPSREATALRHIAEWIVNPRRPRKPAGEGAR